jgi:AAA family ATP:ADP antiporter
MARLLERLFNLQRGDFQRGLLLFFYLFLIISSYVVGKAARAALFLDNFKPSKLPYADITIAALAGFVVAGYVLLGRRARLSTLLISTLILFSSNCAIFWYLAHFHPQMTWLSPVFYIWVGIYGVLAPAQVWTLANFVLTTRQAKRIFGLVGSGAILGWIIGGLITNLLAKHPAYGTESLLLVMAVFLLFSAVLVYFIWQQKEAVVGAEEPAGAREDESASLGESLKLLFSSPYLLSIATVISIASLATTFAGWQFTAIVNQNFPKKDDFAAFLGQFNFLAGMACMLTQLLLTSRVLRRFGIGPALFVVPVAMLGGEIAVLAWGTLVAGVILKSSDQILRYSIDKSSVELLYLPIPMEIKLQVKSFIDTVIWRLGDGLAGATLAIFADYLSWSPRQVSWVNIVFIGGWFVAAFVARRQYVGTLRESIQQHRLDAERASAPVLDRSTIEIFAQNLLPTDPKQILYALSLFDTGGQKAAHPALRALLDHPDAEVRCKALSILSAAGDKSVRPHVETMLQDPELAVRTEALLYLTHHAHVDPLEKIKSLGDYPDFTIRSAMVAFLARPGRTQNLDAAQVMLDTMVKEPGAQGARTRLEAARLLCVLPDEFEEQLRALLADDDADVLRQAIRAVGLHGKRRLVFRVLDRIAHPELTDIVVESLARFGDRIVGMLGDHLSDASVAIEIRREIPTVLVRIGTAGAQRVLVENLLESDTMLRFRVLAALNKIRRDHPELPLDTQMMETVLGAEILGHYRSYQILGTLGGNLESDAAVVKALRESMNQEVERIFRLLSLLHPQYDLHSAYFGLQSTNAVVHANALEFLDNVLKPQLRNALVPLLDSDISIEERVRRANQMVGASMESREQAVEAMVLSSDPWLKSCGAYAIGTLGLKSLAYALEECLNHPDPLLRETARQAKLRLASA